MAPGAGCAANRWRRRSAAETAAASDAPGIRMTNSSPPERASVSPLREPSLISVARAWRARSPAVWP
ncbi:hypothetical protein G6F56_014080 [Rhizopus delemar]|nr:hypothetical protein G6F56_014080 [Rhizopus delemar]